MVFVKVRETYDLKTVQNKMTVIGIHTPASSIIQDNFPGLLMQCKSYRPYSCDVKIACASVLPLDPLGVGTMEGDVAPEDVFNPILYKAISNKGMSQLEARIQYLSTAGASGADVAGASASVDVDSVTSRADEFGVYYGLLSNAHGWKHANPQTGLEMRGLRPFVYDVVATSGDMSTHINNAVMQNFPLANGTTDSVYAQFFLGNSKEMPFLNCLAYDYNPNDATNTAVPPGFNLTAVNCSTLVPSVRIMCGCIIIPPSRLHELFFRMVVEWTLEFTQIRPFPEITNFYGLDAIGGATHYQNYDYSNSKAAVTGDGASILDNSDVAMVSSNVDIKKVM